jgi:hypothetical protein
MKVIKAQSIWPFIKEKAHAERVKIANIDSAHSLGILVFILWPPVVTF